MSAAAANGDRRQAGGEYCYYKNGVRQAIIERWWQWQDAAGEYWLASDRELDSGLCISTRARLQSGRVVEASVRWQGDCLIEARFDRAAGLCFWQRDGGELQSIALPSAAPLYPLMRIYTGAVIKELAELGGEADIVIPDIRPQTPSAEKLQPLLSSRRCALLADDTIVIAGRQLAAEKWRFVGDQYSDDSVFWLSHSGRLLRYSWQQDPETAWRVELVDRPPADAA